MGKTTSVEWAAQIIADAAGGTPTNGSPFLVTETNLQFAQVLLLQSIATSLERLSGRRDDEGNIPNNSGE